MRSALDKWCILLPHNIGESFFEVGHQSFHLLDGWVVWMSRDLLLLLLLLLLLDLRGRDHFLKEKTMMNRCSCSFAITWRWHLAVPCIQPPGDAFERYLRLCHWDLLAGYLLTRHWLSRHLLTSHWLTRDLLGRHGLTGHLRHAGWYAWVE